MKKKLLFVISILVLICFAGCENKNVQSDEYYIDKFKETRFGEYKDNKIRNINCNVNSYSEKEVKVTCSYEVYLCRSVQTNSGIQMCAYKDWVYKTKDKIYDIEYTK